MAAPALIAGVVWAALGVFTSHQPGSRVVLLPSGDGRCTAVVVRNNVGEQTVSRPYGQAKTTADAQDVPSLGQADPAAVRAEFKTLFELRPPNPERFNLLFDAGGTNLTPASMRALDDVVAAALARPGADIVVTGHTDTRGSMGDNDALSMRRAQEIAQLLVRKGFPAERIETAGRGEREPEIPTADETDEPRNRRVVIDVR